MLRNARLGFDAKIKILFVVDDLHAHHVVTIRRIGIFDFGIDALVITRDNFARSVQIYAGNTAPLGYAFGYIHGFAFVFNRAAVYRRMFLLLFNS